MDKIPLQTLKVIEKVDPVDIIHNIDVKLKAVKRNHKPSVPSKRVEFEEINEEADFDAALEKRDEVIEEQICTVHLVDTLEKVERELKEWSHEYKDVLKLIRKLNEYDSLDQVLITESELRIEDIRKRITEIEHFKNTIVREARKLILAFEKTKSIHKARLDQASENFKNVTSYLLNQIEAERNLGNQTNLVLRKLERDLRETLNAYENEKAKSEVVEENLRTTKFELHKCRNELSEKDHQLKKSQIKIILLEKQLEESEIREREARDESRSKRSLR